MGKQGGFALATAMMVLALLSVLGTMAIQSATLEVQISAHDRDARAALYLAEAALDEARYYVSRGWGKISHSASTIPDPLSVSLDTDPPPYVAWADDLYVGFTLVAADGESFPVTGNSGNSITLATAAGTKAPPQSSARFLLLRTIPDVSQASVSWDGSSRVLTVADVGWAAATSAAGASWGGWLLWDNAGGVFPVAASASLGSDVQLTLDGSATPSGAFVLAINPWLTELAEGSGTALPGDAASASTDTWERVYYDENGVEIGRSSVRAEDIAGSDTDFTLISAGQTNSGKQTVRLSVFRAGSQMQSIGDWSIDYD